MSFGRSEVISGLAENYDAPAALFDLILRRRASWSRTLRHLSQRRKIKLEIEVSAVTDDATVFISRSAVHDNVPIAVTVTKMSQIAAASRSHERIRPLRLPQP